MLVIVGELLALALTVARYGLEYMNWVHFGMASFLIQWIVLSSAGCLCQLRPWFKNHHPLAAGSISYTIVLLFTLVFSILGQWPRTGSFTIAWLPILNNLLISAIFAGVMLRYFYLQQQLNNKKQAELRARVQALQSRIRPHFLFNSMNTIASLVTIEPQKAEQMIVDLSQLFRASLSEPGLVPLDKEISLCQHFTAIEQMRLGDRLKMEWDIEDSAVLKCATPSLLLQPLVENAIYHGIQPLAQGGKVTVSVQCEEEDVVLKVSNPIDSTATADKDTLKKRNGIALENIRHRLSAYFGDNASCQIETTPASFTVVVRYPTLPSEMAPKA